MPQQIPLNKGQFTLVDDEDFNCLIAFDWKFSSKGYAVRYVKRPNGRWTYVYMHRFLMGVTEHSVEVDHIDLNRLNNTRANLRLATHNQNQWHKGIPANNRTGFKGVNAFAGKFSAGLRWHGQHLHIALVEDPHVAALLYDALARRLFGEFAKPNFETPISTPEVDALLTKALMRWRKKGLNL